MKIPSLVAASALVAATGCATTTPVPAGQLARTEATLRDAAEIDANADPQAAVHLRLANEQVAQARGLMKDGQNRNAHLVLLRAEADAEVALNLARERLAVTDALNTIEAARSAMLENHEGEGR